MNIVRTQLPAADGFPLAVTIHQPSQEHVNNKIVLIASALAVPRSYYGKYAQFLAQEGFTAITFDYRGIGESCHQPLKTLKTSVIEWAEKDIAGLIDWMADHYPSAKLLVVGHSMGGQIIGLVPNNARISALLAVAAQSGYWGLWDGPRKYFMALVWYVLIPSLTRIYSYLPGKRFGLGENVPAGVALEWARWGRNPHYIVDERGQPLRDHFRTFAAPMLVYSFEDDPYAPKRTVEGFLEFYPQARITHRRLSPQDAGVGAIGHFGFFREQFRSSLWRATAEWLKQQ